MWPTSSRAPSWTNCRDLRIQKIFSKIHKVKKLFKVRLQRSEDGANFSTVRLDQELQARVESLQTQGLSLLDDSSQLCAKLLELIKSKKSENSSDVDALVVIEYTLKYQSMIGGIENAKQSLCTIKSLLTEKQNEEEIEQRAEGYLSGQEKLSRDDIEIKLRQEAMISRILKEKFLSKELDIEQLQSDLAASVRVQEAHTSGYSTAARPRRSCTTAQVDPAAPPKEILHHPPKEVLQHQL